MFQLFWQAGRNSSRRNEESHYSGFVIFEHQIRNTGSNGDVDVFASVGMIFFLSKDSDFCLIYRLSQKFWVYVLISSLKGNFPISYEKCTVLK